MAIDLFMKIEEFPGDKFLAPASLDARGAASEQQTIELLSFEWSLNQIGDEQGGRPRSVEHVEHDEFVVTKHVDANTPRLFDVCAKGTYLWLVKVLLHDGVQTTNCPSEGQNPGPDPYLAYTMSGVHIASYSVESDDGIPVETIGMKYGAISVGWKRENHSGNDSDKTGVITRGWANVFDIGGGTGR